jgi:hypothetical protein
MTPQHSALKQQEPTVIYHDLIEEKVPEGRAFLHKKIAEKVVRFPAGPVTIEAWDLKWVERPIGRRLDKPAHERRWLKQPPNRYL